MAGMPGCQGRLSRIPISAGVCPWAAAGRRRGRHDEDREDVLFNLLLYFGFLFSIFYTYKSIPSISCKTTVTNVTAQ
jgi:hypothetical protein